MTKLIRRLGIGKSWCNMMIDGGPEESEDVLMGLSKCYGCGRKWVDTSASWTKKPCRCVESVGWSHASQIPDALVTWDEKIEP